ncbi:MAG: DedA family protein [Ktedonobacterales bacterium]
MSVWLPEILMWMEAYGYLAVWAALFIAAAGAPLPIGLALLAAGAFTAVGDFNPILLALVAISGSVAGDQVGYGIGRWWGRRLLLWLKHSPHFHRLSARAIAPAEAYFARHGGWAVFLTRFLVSGLGGATNLLAGATRYRYLRFLLADITGEALGAIIPLSLGYIFGASWEAAGDVLNAATLFALAAVILLVLSVSLARTIRRIPRRQVTRKVAHSSRQPDWQGTERIPVLLGHASTQLSVRVLREAGSLSERQTAG